MDNLNKTTEIKSADSLIAMLRMETANEQKGACALCGGLQHIQTDDGKVVICACLKNKMHAEKYEEASIPPVFHKLSMSDWNIKQDAFGDPLASAAQYQKVFIGKFMSRYIKSLPAVCAGYPLKLQMRSSETINVNNVILLGGPSSGKTMLAAIAAQQAILSGLSAKYYNFLDLLHMLSGYEYREEQGAINAEWKNLDLVVLDGITAEYSVSEKGPFKTEFDRICKSRMDSGKPIVVTGFSQDDLSSFKKYTGRAWESLEGTCYKLTLPSKIR